MKTALELVTRLFALVACCALVVGLRDTPRSIFEAGNPANGARDTVGTTARLCAQVTDAQGNALRGAAIRVYRESALRTLEAIGRAESDSAGRACFDEVVLGTVWLLAELKEYARASASRTLAGDATVALRLAKAASLTVTVVDELSNPVVGATVLVEASDPIPFGKKSGPQGTAYFARLPPPPWSFRVAAPGYESASRTDVRENTRVTLRRLAALDVRVVDGSGNGVADAAVVIAGPTLWPARRAMTNVEGWANIRGLAAGSYDLSATQSTNVSALVHGFALARGAHETLTLRLEPGRMVTALVTDGEGPNAAAVPGADVVLVEDGIGSFPLRGRTGADGKVTLGPIRRGPASLAARAPDFVGGPLVAVPESNEPVRVPLLRGAVLRGQVVDARGFAIDGAQIEIVGTDRYGLPIAESPLSTNFRAVHFAWSLSGPAPLVPSGELGVMPGPVPPIPRAGAALTSALPLEVSSVASAPWVTDARGEFKAAPVTPGRVRALVRHPEYVEGASDMVSLSPAGEATVRVVLLRGGRLQGRVLDHRGFPVPNVQVDVVAERGAFERSVLTATDGSFAFAAVPREVTLSAARPEDATRVAVRRSITVPEAQRVELDLELPVRREPVRIVVTDERAHPVELAELRVASLDPDVPLRSTLFTDRNGVAELSDARGLSLRVSVDAPRFAAVERDVADAPAEVRVTLDAGVLVAGSVTAVRGRRAVPGALVTLHGSVQRKSMMTDADGAFRFAGVAPGRIEVKVSHPDYAEATRVSEVKRLDRADRAFELPAIDLLEPGEIEGRVLDADGQPVEGARVAVGTAPAYLPQGALPTGVALTSSQGNYVLRRLAAGTVRLEAYAAGLGRGSLDGVVVHEGRTTSDAVIRLRDKDSDDEPLATGGVAITLTAASGHVTIAQVASTSEAERGGLRVNDRIAAIDGSPPTSPADARSKLAGPAGSDVLIDVLREGALLRLRVTREPVRR